MNTIVSNNKTNEPTKSRFACKQVSPQDAPQSREEAIAQGFHFYQSGTPCLHGHFGGRYVANGVCVECNRLRVRKWELENPTKFRAMKRKQMKNYRHKNADATVAWSAWNSARGRGARVPEGTAIADVVRATIPLYRKARELSKATGIRHEVDHILPIQRGGLHSLENLQVVSRSFNAAKRRLTNYEVLEAVIAGEWQFGVSPEVLTITKDRLGELIEDHEEPDSLGILAAQGFLHRVETDPSYQPSLETIRAVFERLQGEHVIH